MKDEELEELLRAMPLKVPRGMPEALPARAPGRPRLTRVLRAIVCFRIPVWQAAAAVLVVWALGKGSSPGGASAPTQTPIQGNAQQARPIAKAEGANASRTLAEGEGFWTLPERYQRMLEAAKRERPWQRRAERSTL